MHGRSSVIYLRPAREDILTIARFHLEKAGPQSARRITERIETGIQSLGDFPFMGPLHPDGFLAQKEYRRFVLSTPYVCIYKVIDETVYVYRIVNGATDYPKLLE